MSSLPLHPAIVHVPLGVAVILPIVAAALTVAVWRGRLPRSVLAVVAGLQLIVATGGLVAMKLGHADERQAALTAPRHAIHEHEEAGEAFVWVSIGVLAVAVASLVVPARAAAAVAAVTTAGTLAVAALGVNAGEKGGELVFHHAASVSATPAPAEAAPAQGAKDDD
jgi:uncharacterized membrane protein